MFLRPTCGTDVIPSDSLTEVKVVKAPPKPEEIGPEAVVSPEGTADSTDLNTAEVSAVKIPRLF